MQVDEAIRARRAIKWYDPEHQMPEETFLKLIIILPKNWTVV